MMKTEQAKTTVYRTYRQKLFLFSQMHPSCIRPGSAQIYFKCLYLKY